MQIFIRIILASDPASVMEDVQNFLGVENYLSREKFVIDPDTGFYCFKKSADVPPICLPEEKVTHLLDAWQQRALRFFVILGTLKYRKAV